MIEGVKITKLNKIEDDRGAVLPMLALSWAGINFWGSITV